MLERPSRRVMPDEPRHWPFQKVAVGQLWRCIMFLFGGLFDCFTPSRTTRPAVCDSFCLHFMQALFAKMWLLLCNGICAKGAKYTIRSVQHRDNVQQQEFDQVDICST